MKYTRKKSLLSLSILILLFILTLSVTQAEGDIPASLAQAVEEELGLTLGAIPPVQMDIKVVAADADTDDEFGASVDIHGNTAVVGAPKADGNRGSAYVFSNSGGSWIQVARLRASVRSGGDFFGWRVAVSGNTVLVGGLDLPGNSAYIFEKPIAGWSDMTETAKLSAPVSHPTGIIYGFAVDIEGDYAIVGAPAYNTPKKANLGAAYVFKKPGASWADMTPTAVLLASDGDEEDAFGSSVAIDGLWAVVGSPYDDDEGKDVGAVYVYKRPKLGWLPTNVHTAKLTPEKPDGEDWLAKYTVDIENGDTIVTGTGNHNATQIGYALVFTKSTTNWVTGHETAVLRASDEALQDFFGYSTYISGDTIMVGSRWDDNANGLNAGAAYFYQKPATGWGNAKEDYKVIAPDGAASDSFSAGVALDGDYAIIGSRLSDHSTFTNAGAAYFYKTPTIIKKVFTSWRKYDGTIRESGENTNTGGWMDSTATECMVGDDWKDRQYRVILHFATGTLPDTAVITQARLAVLKFSFSGTNPFSTHGKLYGDIRAKAFNKDKALELMDFAAGASKVKVVNLKKVAIGDVYRGLLIDEAFPFINVKGNTQFRLRFFKDDNDDMGKDTFNFFCGDTGIVAKRPKFVVWYYVP